MKHSDNLWHKSNGAVIMRRLSFISAWMTGMFCIIVCVLIIIKHIDATAGDPVNHGPLRNLKQLSYKNKQDKQLKKEMLDLELIVRKAFFTSRSQIRTGGFLLLGGIILFLITAKTTVELSRRSPATGKGSAWDDPIRSGIIGRRAIIIFVVILAAVSLILAFRGPAIGFDVTQTKESGIGN